jgi:uncharacterized membrane protein
MKNRRIVKVAIIAAALTSLVGISAPASAASGCPAWGNYEFKCYEK